MWEESPRPSKKGTKKEWHRVLLHCCEQNILLTAKHDSWDEQYETAIQCWEVEVMGEADKENAK